MEDKADFESFFSDCHELVVRTVTLALRDRDLAEDLVQEAFGRAYRRWASVSVMARPEGWLYVVAVRGARRQLRRERSPFSGRAGPALAATAWRYLDQIALSLQPTSVLAADRALRNLAGYLADAGVERFAAVERSHIEGFKSWLSASGTDRGRAPARNTIRQRLGMVRSFFDRIIEWDWPDAPVRAPMFAIDVPVADDPLPRFLDDARAARLLAAAKSAPQLERLVVELLARTGMRASELCDLEADAVTSIGGGWWLRIPLGKLRNDRYVPLHPVLVELLGRWRAGGTQLIECDGRPLDRHRVGRIVKRVARAAGIGHVHPHQLRHTLATQAFNRGMRLEAIAALLGHRSLRMTMTYARIANRTVADEYAPAQARVDALYDDRDEARGSASHASRAPPHARQRLVRPTPGHRLQLRGDL